MPGVHCGEESRVEVGVEVGLFGYAEVVVGSEKCGDALNEDHRDLKHQEQPSLLRREDVVVQVSTVEKEVAKIDCTGKATTGQVKLEHHLFA